MKHASIQSDVGYQASDGADDFLQVHASVFNPSQISHELNTTSCSCSASVRVPTSNSDIARSSSCAIGSAHRMSNQDDGGGFFKAAGSLDVPEENTLFVRSKADINTRDRMGYTRLDHAGE